MEAAATGNEIKKAFFKLKVILCSINCVLHYHPVNIILG